MYLYMARNIDIKLSYLKVLIGQKYVKDKTNILLSKIHY